MVELHQQFSGGEPAAMYPNQTSSLTALKGRLQKDRIKWARPLAVSSVPREDI